MMINSGDVYFKPGEDVKLHINLVKGKQVEYWFGRLEDQRVDGIWHHMSLETALNEILVMELRLDESSRVSRILSHYL